MLYLIGGASRAGKTYMAKRLMSMLDTPLLELDYLKMGLANGLPEYGVHPLKDEETNGELLWPIVSGMIKAMVANGHDYIIEGTYVLPAHAVEMRSRYGSDVRSCFLGYAGMAPAEKLAEARRYGPGPDDWLDGYDDQSALAEIEHFVIFSKYLREECARHGLAYFEVTDREQAVDQGIRYFLEGG